MTDEPTNPTPAPEPNPTPEPEAPTSPEAARSALTALREEIRGLHAIATPTAAQEARMTAALAEYEPLEQRVAAHEARSAAVARATASVTGTAPAYDGVAPGQINRSDPFQGETRGTKRGELRDRALRAVEQRTKEGTQLSARQGDALDKLLRSHDSNVDGEIIARRLLITESDAYRSAFTKALSGSASYTAQEAHAVDEFRAANEGTGSAGGYGVPVLIDPTIILTSGAAAAPVLDISTVKTITTNAWKGVSSQGMTWAYDVESAVVADGTPTLAQPSIPVYKADGFVPYTIEVGADYPGFQDEIAMVMAQGYLNLMASKTINGTGTNEPWGILAHMNATSSSPAHVTVTTKGTLGSVDVRAAWTALPERFRSRATWLMNVQEQELISAFGNGLALSDYTVNLLSDGTAQLRGRKVVVTDYFPAFTNTTATESALVVGDFSHFLIIQRAGMTVEPVPHLFDPTTGRPIGQRGIYAYARVGHDFDTPLAFRVLANT